MYEKYHNYQGKAIDAYVFEAKSGTQGLTITCMPDDQTIGASLEYTIWLTDGGLRQVHVLDGLKAIGHPIETLQSNEAWEAIGPDLRSRKPAIAFEYNEKERYKDKTKFDPIAGWIGAPGTSRPKEPRGSAVLGAGTVDVAKRALEFANAVASGKDPKEFLKAEIPF